MSNFVSSRIDVLTAKEAAELLDGKISYWTLLQLVKKGQVPHFRLGKRILFRKESIMKWLADLEGRTMQNVNLSIGVIRKID